MHRTIETSLGEIMAEYLDGDTRAFRELYDTLRPRVRRQMAMYIADSATVDDLVQLVFMHAHIKRHTFVWPQGDRNRAVLAWYAAIARNRAIDELRKRARRQSRTTSIDDSIATEFNTLAQQMTFDQEEHLLDEEARTQRVEQVRRAVAQLPPLQREVVQLHKLHGLSMEEIAKRTGVRPGTLRVRAHRAYRSLANLLSARLEQPAADVAA